MELKVNKIVAVTSNVEATSGNYTVKADVRVRNSDTIEGISNGYVVDEKNNQVANFNYYSVNSMNVNYQTSDSEKVTAISTAIGEFIAALEAEPASVIAVNETTTSEA